MKKFILLTSALVAALSVSGCKKDNSESTTTPSLSGLTINEAPSFVGKGAVLSFNADVSKIYVSSGDMPTVGLFWQVNTAKKDTLTRNIKESNPTFTYTVDTLGTYNVVCYAYAGSGYYNTSATSTFIAVDPEKVIQGYEGSHSSPEFIAQDGKAWSSFNEYTAESGLSFRNSPILDYAAGRMYNQEEAKNACPAGMHLPSVADFRSSFGQADGTILSAEMMADATFNGDKMWEYFPAVQISNAKHFNAMPLGYVDTTDAFNTYNHFGEYACYWTKDEKDGLGKYMYIYANNPVMQEGLGDKTTLYMGVRCVKD